MDVPLCTKRQTKEQFTKNGIEVTRISHVSLPEWVLDIRRASQFSVETPCLGPTIAVCLC